MGDFVEYRSCVAVDPFRSSLTISTLLGHGKILLFNHAALPPARRDLM